MAFSKQFERELDDMFYQRTHWLRSELGVIQLGKPPVFSRKQVNKGINKLQNLASDAFSHKLAKTEFEKYAKIKKSWHIKGHGRDDKKRKFSDWYFKTFNPRKGCIYVFWGKDNKCIYVGRTGAGGSRPIAHFEKFWFNKVKLITLYIIHSKSHIPKLECLAMHRFQPKYNMNKAATKKWTKTCPLCEIHRLIEKELRRIFRFKS